MHIYQISVFGKPKSTDILHEFEKAAFNSEKSWWSYYNFVKGEKVRKDWIKIIPQIIDNLDNINQVGCPICKEYEIDYLYVGDEETRVGYLHVWCKKCLKGISISRTRAPRNAKFVTFDYNIDSLVPMYDIVEN